MNKRERYNQVLRHLFTILPPPYPTSLEFPADMAPGLFAVTEFETTEIAPAFGKVIISLELRRVLSEGIHDLVHEYAHAAMYQPPHVGIEHAEHGPIWASAYGILYRDFYDEDGDKKSKEL